MIPRPISVVKALGTDFGTQYGHHLWVTFQEFILGLARGGTAVVYSTHNVAEAEHYAQQVIVLADGERLFAGSPRELERVVGDRPGGDAGGFEAAFVAFLRQRGH